MINYKYEIAFHWCEHVTESFKNAKFYFIYKPDFMLQRSTDSLQLHECTLKNK